MLFGRRDYTVTHLLTPAMSAPLASNHSVVSSCSSSTLSILLILPNQHLFDLGCKWLALSSPLELIKTKVFSDKYLGLLQPSLMQKHLFLDTRVKMCFHELSDFPAHNRGIDV